MSVRPQGFVANRLHRAPSSLGELFRSPLLRLGRFGLSESRAEGEHDVLPKAFAPRDSRTRTTVYPEYVMTDFDVGWYEFLGEPLGVRLHVRTYLFGIARIFGAASALVTRDDETPLSAMFERHIGWEQALATIDWPRVDASFEQLCTAQAHGKSVWLDSFDVSAPAG